MPLERSACCWGERGGNGVRDGDDEDEGEEDKGVGVGPGLISSAGGDSGWEDMADASGHVAEGQLT